MTELKQRTLDGDTTDQGRVTPDTFRYCLECEDDILRSRWGDHEEHHRQEVERWEDIGKTLPWEEDGEDDDPPEKAGEWYDVDLSYSVEYRFRVPAWSEQEAKRIAKELKWDATPADSYHVHTDIRNPWGMDDPEIYTDDPDLPEDFDIYGNETLYDVLVAEADDDD